VKQLKHKYFSSFMKKQVLKNVIAENTALLGRTFFILGYMNPGILVVDDDNSTLFGYTKYLSGAGYEVATALTLQEADRVLLSRNLDIILLDLNLPDGSGMDWIPKIKKKNPETAIIIITGDGGIKSAVEAMQRGADHYLTKPVNLEELNIFITKHIELQSLRRKDEAQRRTQKKMEPFFGNSSVMKKVFELASMSTENNSVLLLHGETGTGKGLLARWIHNRSSRSLEPFVEVNCASLRGELLSSELFGHVKGAFTSAVQDRQGLIEVANNGTLFLDEIGDMDLGIQAQFLKAIEEKTYRRLGENRERTSDFRLICATHRDLSEEVAKGRFRGDLYYRICVFPIDLPDLRERFDDLPGLIQDILGSLRPEAPEIADEVVPMLKKYSWPGNIRELRNMMERALILSQGKKICCLHFPGLDTVQEAIPSRPANDKLEGMENQYIQKILAEHDGDTKKASETLGISRASLYRKLNKAKDSLST
jgi:DNA-binding NtrC family response regulator